MTVIKPLTRLQKIVAYASLVVVLACTVFGIFAIWVIVTRDG